VPKPFPEEFRRDVVAVARRREAPLTQIAKDFGISEPTLHSWLKKADIEDGNRPELPRTNPQSCAKQRSGSDCSSRKRK
jgi:transposase